MEADYSKVWESVRRFWDYPRINSPELLDKSQAAEKGMEKEIAAIRMDNSQIMVNMPNLKQRVGLEHLARVESHEVGHYKYIPYDLKNFVRLVGYADTVTRNMKMAQHIQNLYTDLCVNTKSYKKGDKGMIELYRKLSKGNNSEAWQAYMATFENMMGCPGTIIPTPNDKIMQDAKKLAEIVGNAMDSSSKWPDSIKEFAKIMKQYLEEEKEQNNNNGNGQTDTEKGLIDRHNAKDFMPCDPDKTQKDVLRKIVEKELKGLAKELGQKEFKRVLSGLGIATPKKANLMYYRQLASEYSLFMPKVPSQNSGNFKNIPKRWTIDEPFDQLDIEYTLRQSPIIIPNATTYQWETANGNSFASGRGTPDLLIAIDSSGSMPDPNEEISFPVLSAMIASRAALNAGNRVAVVNFSHDYAYCEFTNQSQEIDETLIHYFEQNTEIPGETMAELASKNTCPVHALIISDTEIENLQKQKSNLEKTLRSSKAGGSIFLNCEPSKHTKLLENMGYSVKFARDFEDIGRLTLEKSRELYKNA